MLCADGRVPHAPDPCDPPREARPPRPPVTAGAPRGDRRARGRPLPGANTHVLCMGHVCKRWTDQGPDAPTALASTLVHTPHARSCAPRPPAGPCTLHARSCAPGPRQAEPHLTAVGVCCCPAGPRGSRSPGHPRPGQGRLAATAGGSGTPPLQGAGASGLHPAPQALPPGHTAFA